MHQRKCSVTLGLLAACMVWSVPALATGDVLAVKELATRLLGAEAATFQFESIPAEDGMTVFEVEARGGTPIIRGSDGVAMATGLNWYLKNACHASVSWFSNQLSLPKPLPDIAKARITSPYKYRYYFNYCTFSYTLAWWDWERWEREIDWMALNGINAPLSVTGQEAIWQKVYKDLGLTQEELDKFFVGPAYLPFGWMGCMDGWGGPLTQDWIDRHRDLEKQIVARERELGMTPVLQGFTGHAPEALKRVFPGTKLQQTSPWCAFPATYFLDPGDPLFTQIGTAFIEEQTKQYGTDHLYAADTFIEMSPPSNDPAFLDQMGKAILGSMTVVDPEAVWVMQGWIFFNNPKFWQPPQAKAFLGSVPDNHMLLLDLFCDKQPTWTLTESFYGKPWAWCIVHGFGGNVSLFGDLAGIANNLPSALKDGKRGQLVATGLLMEGIEQNPIIYDFMTEMAFRVETPPVREWVKDWARRRYGMEDGHASAAWDLMRKTVYTTTGAPPAMLCKRPSLDLTFDKPPYAIKDVCQAWNLLLSCADRLGQSESYQYDLVTVGRQVLVNLTATLHQDMMKAYKAKDKGRFAAASKAYLALLDDLDTLLATRPEFLLGRWTAAARKWGNTPGEKQHLEWNARDQITLWGPRDSMLHGYAQKHWSGLISGYYRPRWEQFIQSLTADLDNTIPFDAAKFNETVMDWEWVWVHGAETYPDQPEGNSVEISKAMFAKYHGLAEQKIR